MIYVKRSRRLLAVAGLGILGSAVAVGFSFHKKPEVKPKASHACGCSMTDPAEVAALARVDDQSPAQMSFVSMVTGQGRQFAINTGSGLVAAGGTWSAAFGTIDSNGNYTAPSDLPPAATDYVTYTDPDGNTVVGNVLLTANANVSGSGVQPYITNSALPSDPYYTSGTSSTTSPYTQAQATFPSGAVVEEPAGATPESPIIPDTTAAEVDKPIGTSSGMYIPTIGSAGASSTTLYLVANPSAALVGLAVKKHPIYPTLGPKGPCTGSGTANVCGPISTTEVPGKWDNEGSVTVTLTASMAATIDSIFSLNLTAGVTLVANLQVQTISWKRTKKCDVYKCVNNAWVYQYSTVCTSLAVGVNTIPSWYCVIEGYPAYGNPNGWGNWACSTTN